MKNEELIAIVEELYRESDARVFTILNKIIDVIMENEINIDGTQSN